MEDLSDFASLTTQISIKCVEMVSWLQLEEAILQAICRSTSFVVGTHSHDVKLAPKNERVPHKLFRRQRHSQNVKANCKRMIFVVSVEMARTSRSNPEREQIPGLVG